MMDWTDRHCRFFLRLLSPTAVLYTEMVTAAAVAFGDARRLLEFNPEEHPIVLQLGGNDPEMMADAAARGAQFGYDCININVGCPSDRVQDGRFGACLMARPREVATTRGAQGGCHTRPCPAAGQDHGTSGCPRSVRVSRSGPADRR